jgi:hypothetical protein
LTLMGWLFRREGGHSAAALAATPPQTGSIGRSSMNASYHYRVAVATGYANEVRALIEAHASVASHNDGSIAADGNDTTVLAVIADGFGVLPGLKTWADAHRAELLTLVTATGTPLTVRDTDLASLRASVEAHPELEPAVPQAPSADSERRFEWHHGGIAAGRGAPTIAAA